MRPPTSARSPRRAATGGSSRRAASPASPSASTAATQRWRGPNVDSPAAAAQVASNARRNSCTGCPGTLWWISALGSRSARSDGRSMSETRVGERQRQRDRLRPAPPRPTRRPHSSQVPSTITPPGPSAARIVSHACAADASSYCRSTLNARTSTGCRPASSKPPTPEVHPRRVAVGGHRRDARRVDLQADDLQAGPPPAPSRSTSSSVVTADDAVAEVDDQRPGGVAQAGELGGQQPAVRPGAAGSRSSSRAWAARARGPGRRPAAGPCAAAAETAMPGACGRSRPRSPVRRVVPVSVASCRFDATSRWRTSPPSASAARRPAGRGRGRRRTGRRRARRRRGRASAAAARWRLQRRRARRAAGPGTSSPSAPAGSSGTARRLVVQAGEPWDDLVAYAVANGLAGIEALSRHPGLDRGDAGAERRRLRPGGRADDHRRPRLRPRREVRAHADARPSAASPTATAGSSGSPGGSSSST